MGFLKIKVRQKNGGGGHMKKALTFGFVVCKMRRMRHLEKKSRGWQVVIATPR